MPLLPKAQGPAAQAPAPQALPRPRAWPLSAAPLLLASLALGACSPYRLGPPPTAPNTVATPLTGYLDSMASVCVIRTTPHAAAVTFLVHDNRLLVGATRGPTYFCWRAQPGSHRIVITGDDGGQRFDVQLVLRGRYYLEQRLDDRRGLVTPRGLWVDEPTATLLLKRSAHRILEGAPARESLLLGTDIAAAAP